MPENRIELSDKMIFQVNSIRELALDEIFIMPAHTEKFIGGALYWNFSVRVVSEQAFYFDAAVKCQNKSLHLTVLLNTSIKLSIRYSSIGK